MSVTDGLNLAPTSPFELVSLVGSLQCLPGQHRTAPRFVYVFLVTGVDAALRFDPDCLKIVSVRVVYSKTAPDRCDKREKRRTSYSSYLLCPRIVCLNRNKR